MDVAAIGFDTILVNRLVNTSPKEIGVCSVDTSVISNVTGKMKLPATASNAAMNELSKYLDTTVRNREPRRPLAFATDATMRMKTKMGAMAFKALTNNIPRMETNVHWGTKSPMSAPTTIPMRIRNIRLILVHLWTMLDSVFMLTRRRKDMNGMRSPHQSIGLTRCKYIKKRAITSSLEGIIDE